MFASATRIGVLLACKPCGAGVFDFSAERGGSGRRERGQKEEGLFFHTGNFIKIAICFLENL